MTLAADVINILVKIGLYDVILPFILIFSISYGLLERNKVLSENKNINAVVSLVLGLLIVAAANLLNMVNLGVTYFVLVIIGLIIMLVITKLVNKDWTPGKWPLGIGFLFLIIIALVLFGNLINWEKLFKFLEPIIPLLIFLAIIGLILWFVMEKKPKQQTAKPSEKPKQDTEGKLPSEMKGTPKLKKVREITPEGSQEID